MPNTKRCNLNSSTLIVLTLLGLMLSGCATTPTDPILLTPADDAIALAEEAGARTHAVLELEEAEALRSEAERLLDEGETDAVIRLIDQAVLQARLAAVRSEGAKARQTLAEQRATLDMLEEDLLEAYGDQIDLEPQP